MKRYSIKTKKTYTKNGEEKSIWLDVGTITDFGDGLGLELNQQPDTKFYVFEHKPKELVSTEEQFSNDLPF